MSDQETIQEQATEQRVTNAEAKGLTLATQQQSEQSTAKVENPEFLAQISDPSLASEKYQWLKEELPALFARANFLGNRSDDYEKQVKWLNQNKVERKIIMHNPGRLTKAVKLDHPALPTYPILELAQRVHGREEKDVRREFHSDDRQALRHGGEAATNYMSNAVDGAGRRAVAESTAVSKVEKEEERSTAENAARRVWG